MSTDDDNKDRKSRKFILTRHPNNYSVWVKLIQAKLGDRGCETAIKTEFAIPAELGARPTLPEILRTGYQPTSPATRSNSTSGDAIQTEAHQAQIAKVRYDVEIEEYERKRKARETAIKRNYNALEIIRDNLTATDMTATAEQTMAKDLWSLLESKSNPANYNVNQNIEERWVNLKQGPTQTLDDFLMNTFDRIILDLNVANSKIHTGETEAATTKIRCKKLILALDNARYKAGKQTLINKVFTNIEQCQQEIRDLALCDDEAPATALMTNPKFGNGNQRGRGGNRGGRGKRGNFNQRGGYSSRGGGNSGHNPGHQNDENEKGPCKYCGGDHPKSKCIECYRCKGKGHKANQCPNPDTRQSKGKDGEKPKVKFGDPPATKNYYTITEDETDSGMADIMDDVDDDSEKKEANKKPIR